MERNAAILGQLWKLEFSLVLPQAEPSGYYSHSENWAPANLKVLELAYQHVKKGDKVLIGSDLMAYGKWVAEQLNYKDSVKAVHITEESKITGKLQTKNPQKRANIVYDFRNDSANVLCASLNAMNLGHNLDMANVVILKGLPWDFATFDQFIARVHRLTSKQPVIQRLNNAIDCDWSFEIVEHIIQDNDVAVLGKLSTNGVVKMQWGSRKIKKNSKTGEIICLGDDLKAAASDSLKKAASLLGCGLHIYTDDELEPLVPVTNKSEEKITQEQLAQIKKLRTELNWPPNKVQEYAQQMFRTDVLEINPTMAQAFIAFLKIQVNSKPEKQETQETPKPQEDPPF